jgi:hypothetical protein
MSSNLFCERNVLFIKQPLNSISGLSYIIVAIMILKKTKKLKYIIYSILQILLGISTYGMHAFNTSFYGNFDMISMFFNILYSLSLNITNKPIISLLIMPYFLLIYKIYPKILNLKIFSFFTGLWILSYLPKLNKNIIIGYSWFLFATICWLLDRFKLFCYPKTIFQLHSIWHIASAIGFYYLYLYDLQL